MPKKGALTQLFDDMYKRRLEAARGRIWFNSGLWEWTDKVPEDVMEQHASGKVKMVHYHDEDKREFTLYRYSKEHERFYRLVKGPSVVCPHPEFTDEDYMPDIRMGEPTGRHYVPSRICKRCEHYRKGGSVSRKIRYPTCAYRADDNPERAAAEGVLHTFSEASTRAQEIIG